MSQERVCITAPFQLRLFDPAETAEVISQEAGPLSADMGLGAFYRSWIRPVLFVDEQSDASTIGEYDRSIALWVALTGDPPLRSLDAYHDVDGETERFIEDVVRAFMVGLWKLKGLRKKTISPPTVHRRVRNIQYCLRLAGPPDGRRKGKRLIRIVPYLPLPSLENKEPEGPQLWELTKILACGGKMKTPNLKWVSNEVFWRSVGALAYNTAERRGAILRVKYSDIRELRVQRALPGMDELAEIKAFELRVPGPIRKGKRRQHVIPLNDGALAAIDALRGDTPREEIVGWPYSIANFSRKWMKLVRLAGFPDEERFNFHRIRSTAITEAEIVKEGSGTMLAGHSDSRVTSKYYKQRRVLRAVLDRLPQPF